MASAARGDTRSAVIQTSGGAGDGDGSVDMSVPRSHASERRGTPSQRKARSRSRPLSPPQALGPDVLTPQVVTSFRSAFSACPSVMFFRSVFLSRALCHGFVSCLYVTNLMACAAVNTVPYHGHVVPPVRGGQRRPGHATVRGGPSRRRATGSAGRRSVVPERDLGQGRELHCQSLGNCTATAWVGNGSRPPLNRRFCSLPHPSCAFCENMLCHLSNRAIAAAR